MVTKVKLYLMNFKLNHHFTEPPLLDFFIFTAFGVFIRGLLRYQANRSLKKADNDRKAAELEAKIMQQNMLPKIFPNFCKYFEISAGLITSTEVGGDYYDFFEPKNDEVLAVCVETQPDMAQHQE